MLKTSKYGAFDGLRLMAALGVLLNHSYVLTGHNDQEPLVRLTDGKISFGDAAVYVFFALSGYLVTQSWFRDPSFTRFMARRLLRIVPALAFVIIISATLIGPLLTTLSLPEYFSRSETWTYLAKILVFPTQYGLPGTFETNLYPNVVNGSLWSLRVECALYIAVAAMGAFGFLRWRWLNITAALSCLTMGIVLTQTTLLNTVPYLHQTTIFFLNAVPFFTGAALAETELNTKWMKIALALTLATMLLLHTPLFGALFLLTLPLTVILIARYGNCDLHRYGDYSYGLYLWAFPIQQSLIHFMPAIAPLPLFLSATAISLACASLSWHLIEKRALALKPRQPRKGAGKTGRIGSEILKRIL